MTKEKSSNVKQSHISEPDSSSRQNGKILYCSVPKMPERVFGPNVDIHRASLIRLMADKWVNGTVLHYYFFDQESDGSYVYFTDGTREWETWVADKAQKNVVRNAFDIWKDVGIGIEFNEVDSRDDAEVRIGFMPGDGSWSYIGRYILNIGINKRTMNFGWDLTNDIDTAVHEIGHTLGFPHEHQNPYAGIVWDEEAVYAELAKPPNNWSREMTYDNIIKKITPDTIQGSNWDPDSIMHYPFAPGLIREPAQYRNGLYPIPGLSDRDQTWVSTFYPPLNPQQDTELEPFKSVELELAEGEQRNFVILPTTTRYYDIRTFGTSDTVMVLFEEENGELKYRTADDDSGEDYNASLRVRLIKGHKYVLRIRLYWSDVTGRTAVMMW